jgi:hypothetical protein
MGKSVKSNVGSGRAGRRKSGFGFQVSDFRKLLPQSSPCFQGRNCKRETYVVPHAVPQDGTTVGCLRPTQGSRTWALHIPSRKAGLDIPASVTHRSIYKRRGAWYLQRLKTKPNEWREQCPEDRISKTTGHNLCIVSDPLKPPASVPSSPAWRGDIGEEPSTRVLGN